MRLDPNTVNIPVVRKTRKSVYLDLVQEFLSTTLDTIGVALDESETASAVKRGLSSAIKTNGLPAVAVTRKGGVFLATELAAQRLGLVTYRAPRKRRKKPEDTVI